MKKKFEDMPTPLNANERFLFGIGQRLEALLEAIESIGNVKEPVKTEATPILDEKLEEAKPIVKRTRKAPVKKEE